jgi:hypothetical protein
MRTSNCPICSAASQSELFSDNGKNLYEVGCPRCGKYFITDYARDHIEGALQSDNRGIEQYRSMGDDLSNNPTLTLYVEVAEMDRDIMVLFAHRDWRGASSLNHSLA